MAHHKDFGTDSQRGSHQVEETQSFNGWKQSKDSGEIGQLTRVQRQENHSLSNPVLIGDRRNCIGKGVYLSRLTDPEHTKEKDNVGADLSATETLVRTQADTRGIRALSLAVET